MRQQGKQKALSWPSCTCFQNPYHGGETVPRYTSSVLKKYTENLSHSRKDSLPEGSRGWSREVGDLRRRRALHTAHQVAPPARAPRPRRGRGTAWLGQCSVTQETVGAHLRLRSRLNRWPKQAHYVSKRRLRSQDQTSHRAEAAAPAGPAGWGLKVGVHWVLGEKRDLPPCTYGRRYIRSLPFSSSSSLHVFRSVSSASWYRLAVAGWAPPLDVPSSLTIPLLHSLLCNLFIHSVECVVGILRLFSFHRWRNRLRRVSAEFACSLPHGCPASAPWPGLCLCPPLPPSILLAAIRHLVWRPLVLPSCTISASTASPQASSFPRSF